jgi:DNA-binding transcriptional LysR family regulator
MRSARSKKMRWIKALTVWNKVLDNTVAPRSASVRTRLARSQALKPSINYLECPTCHTAIDLVKRKSGPAIVHTFCLSQVEADGIRAIDLGRSFGVEQFVIAYKASTVKQPVMRDLLEWLTR